MWEQAQGPAPTRAARMSRLPDHPAWVPRWMPQERTCLSWCVEPALNLESGHPIELAHIVGDQDAISSPRDRGDEKVHDADRTSPDLEIVTNSGEVSGRI